MSEKFRIIEDRKSDDENELEKMRKLPCESEAQRLELQHALLKYTWQSNFSAPVDELLRSENEKDEDKPLVLDVGCGTGAWIIEMAQDYPNARFGGIRLNDNIAVPVPGTLKNVEIRRMNIISDLIPYENGVADYVFIRTMAVTFTGTDWNRVIEEILRVTKIGGYIEFAELDIRLSTEGEYTKKILDILRSYLTGLRGKPRIVMELPGLLENTEIFESIGADGLHMPVGDWAGSVGNLMGRNVKQFLRSNKPQLTEANEISGEDFDDYIEKAVAEFDGSRATMFFGRIYGRKKA